MLIVSNKNSGILYNFLFIFLLYNNMPIVELNDSKNPILKIQYGESKNIIIMLIAIPPIGLYLLLNINPKLENNSMINALRLEKAIPVIITYINVIRSDIFSFKSFLNIKNIIHYFLIT